MYGGDILCRISKVPSEIPCIRTCKHKKTANNINLWNHMNTNIHDEDKQILIQQLINKILGTPWDCE